MSKDINEVCGELRSKQGNGMERNWRDAPLGSVVRDGLSEELALESGLSDMKEEAMERWPGSNAPERSFSMCKGPGTEWEDQARACE